MASTGKPAPFGFLLEALFLPAKNKKLFFHIFVLHVCTYSLLFLCNRFTVQPLLAELTADYKAMVAKSMRRSLAKDAEHFVVAESVFFVVFFVATSLLRVLGFFMTISTCSGETLEFRELAKKARSNMKGPVVTLFLVSVLLMAYSVSLIVIMTILLLLAENSLLLISLATLSSLFPLGFLVYLSVVSSMSVVIATAESGCSGIAAVRRAWRFLKGRKIQVFLLLLTVAVLSATISPIVGSTRHLSVGIVYVVLVEIVDLFAMAAVTTLYFDCRRNSRGKEEEAHPTAKHELVVLRKFGYDTLPVEIPDHGKVKEPPV